MLYVCVRDVIDVAFSVCIVMCGTVDTRDVSVSSCRCMFMDCVHPVAVPNASFCMICSLLLLVENSRGNHMEEAYSNSDHHTHQHIVYIIMMADKYNIPNGKMHIKCNLLPDYIVCKITHKTYKENKHL